MLNKAIAISGFLLMLQLPASASVVWGSATLPTLPQTAAFALFMPIPQPHAGIFAGLIVLGVGCLFRARA